MDLHLFPSIIPFFIFIPALFGFFALSNLLLTFLTWTWTMFLRPPKDLTDYGSWALITGSTDGIGKALAFDLASKGLNLLLVGRSPPKLHLTSQEIRQKHPGVAIKTVVIDFDKCPGEEIVRMIEEETRGIDLGILINNAGLAYPYARFCHEVDKELMESLVKVNVEGTTWVTRAVIGKMLEKKRGAIVNIGSGSTSCVPSYPLYSIYAASKAYVAMVSKSIGVEYRKQGIDVQCQIPLLVATKMASIKKPSFFIPSAETYSKASMRWIGYEHPLCIPYWPHAFQAWCFSLLPATVLNSVIFSYFLGVRARGLRKDSKISSSKK